MLVIVGTIILHISQRDRHISVRYFDEPWRSAPIDQNILKAPMAFQNMPLATHKSTHKSTHKFNNDQSRLRRRD